MTVAAVYGLASLGLLSAKFDVESDTLKCALFDDTYVPDLDADEFYGDLTGEISDRTPTPTNYTVGGVVLTNVEATYVSGSNKSMVDCDDPTWPTVTHEGVRFAVFYKWSGSAATSPLLSYMDFESDQDATASTWSIVIPVTGLFDAAV